MNSEAYVGVDVSKASLDVKVLPTNETLKISNDNDGPYLETVNAHNMRFYTNSGERMRIASDGSVGIGTTSPTSKINIDCSSIRAFIAFITPEKSSI